MLIRDLLTELHREAHLRAVVFPKLITQGRLSQHEAQERTERLAAAADVLRTLQRMGFQTPDQVHAEAASGFCLTKTSGETSKLHIIKGAE